MRHSPDALGSALHGSRLMLVRTVVDVSVNLLLSILIVRALGQAALGAYIYASSLAGLAYSILALGITAIITRDIAQDPARARSLLTNAIAIRLLVTLPLGLTTAIVLNWILPQQADGGRLVLLVMLMVGLGLVTDILFGAFQAVGKFHYHLTLSVIHKLGMLAGTTIAVYLGYGIVAIVGWFVGMQVITLLLSVVVLVRRVTPLSLRFELSTWPPLLRMSTPLALSAFSETVNNRSDTVLLGIMRTASEVGIYGAAYNVYLGLCQLVSSLVVGGFPSLSRAAASRSAALGLFRNLAAILVVATGLAAIGVWLTSAQLVRFVYGADMAIASEPLNVLVLALTFFGLQRLCLATLTSLGMQRWVFWATMAGAVVNVGANLVLIPAFGYIGASYSTLVSEVTIVAASLLFLYSPSLSPVNSGWSGERAATAATGKATNA